MNLFINLLYRTELLELLHITNVVIMPLLPLKPLLSVSFKTSTKALRPSSDCDSFHCRQVLDVLCSLCVGNGVAVRSNQNLIMENLMPGRDLLLQTSVVDYVYRLVTLIQVCLASLVQCYRWVARAQVSQAFHSGAGVPWVAWVQVSYWGSVKTSISFYYKLWHMKKALLVMSCVWSWKPS